MVNRKDYSPDHTAIRAKLLAKHDNRCQACHRRPRTGEVLHMHHIDGQKRNNKEFNLMILCCKCHALKHGFKVTTKNKIIHLLKNTNIKYMCEVKKNGSHPFFRS